MYTFNRTATAVFYPLKNQEEKNIFLQVDLFASKILSIFNDSMLIQVFYIWIHGIFPCDT